jgi:hypothetical protein
VVGVETEARLAAGDPQCLVGPGSARLAGGGGVLRQPLARDKVVRRRVAALGRAPGDRLVGGDVGDVDLHQEAHPVEELDERGRPAGLGVGGERLAVVDAGERVLDVSLRREDQRLGPAAGGQVEEVLGRQRVQPGQPVGPADADHLAVGEVDEPVVGLEHPLLAVERAVVGGHAGVHAVAGHGARQVEERAGHGCSSWLGSDGHSTHAPNTVRCPTSTVKLCSPRSRSVSGCSMSGPTEETRPQFRHTRWKCSWSDTEW